MKSNKFIKYAINQFFLFGILACMPLCLNAQSYSAWYKNAQERIDTLRKGSFGVTIIDKNGIPYKGNVSVRMAKHEYPFGIAFDLNEGSVSMGSTYTSGEAVQAERDAEIYSTERYGKSLSYVFPTIIGKEYRLTLKFAEIYFTNSGARLFDVHVEDQLFLNDFDIYVAAGGKNEAVDTSITIIASDDILNLKLTAVKDNAAIKGIAFSEIESGNTTFINCGGAAITTSSGNKYVSEDEFIDPDVATVASKEQWMKATMYKYFNYGVSGNSFKWSGIQENHVTPNYINFDNAVKWTQKVGWELRAHTLLWGDTNIPVITKCPAG